MDLLKISNIPTVEIMHIDSSPNFLANIGIDQYAAARYLIKFLVEEKNVRILHCVLLG